MKVLDIGIDIDDTVAEMLEDWLEHIVAKTGLPLGRWAPFLDGGFFTFWKEVQTQTGYNPMAWWHTPDLYCNRDIIPEAVKTISIWMNQGHNVFFISSSIDDHITSKDGMIRRYWPNAKIIHTSHKDRVKMDVFIDDAEHNMMAVQEAQPECYKQMPTTLVNASFSHTTPGSFWAVDNWVQIRNNVEAFMYYNEQG